MKCKLFIPLFLLLTIHAIKPMEQYIEIHNSNLKKVMVILSWKDLVTGCKESNANDLTIREGITKKIYLNQKINTIQTTQLDIQDAVPRFISLNITQNGAIRFKDCLTVIRNESDNSFTIYSNRGICSFTLPHITAPVFIGYPSNNPFSDPHCPQQILTIRNKDLFQVTVLHKALRQPSNETIDTIENSKRIKKMLLNDAIVASYKYPLRKGEETTLLTCSSDHNPNIIKTITKLRIPEATQDVIININQRTISSGDTLEVTLSETNKIFLVKIRDGQETLLASLYCEEPTFNVMTIGQ